MKCVLINFLKVKCIEKCKVKVFKTIKPSKVYWSDWAYHIPGMHWVRFNPQPKCTKPKNWAFKTYKACPNPSGRVEEALKYFQLGMVLSKTCTIRPQPALKRQKPHSHNMLYFSPFFYKYDWLRLDQKYVIHSLRNPSLLTHSPLTFLSQIKP